ncbi:hypothetical protein J4416_02170 [Candidatus Pacearchaeota archaeon]|nr:hypothetical protein [Candidatus Pacearchaeota archaeon]
MKISLKLTIFLLLQVILLINFVNALSVNSITTDRVSPGSEGIIRVELENDGNLDVKFLSFNLEFPHEGIIPIGGSEAFIDRLKENDDETVAFKFRVSNSLSTGVYSISYSLTYEENNIKREQKGTLGIVVAAEPDIDVFIEAQNPIVGQIGKLNIRIVNKGLADARFVSLFIDSEDVTFLSEKSEYIGTIDSDDFESTSFDVIYNGRLPLISTRVEYKDFDNQNQKISISNSLRVYTLEEAIEKGILKKNNATLYVAIILFVLLVWILFRIVRKRRKMLKK